MQQNSKNECYTYSLQSNLTLLCAAAEWHAFTVTHNMELTLSRDCAIQTDLLTSDGRCLYTIFTPNKLTIKTTTITKHVLDEDGRTSLESIELARINWNPFGSSRLVYDGKIVDFSRFMPGEGMLNRYLLVSSQVFGNFTITTGFVASRGPTASPTSGRWAG